MSDREFFERLRAERGPRRAAERARAEAAISLDPSRRGPPRPGYVDITCSFADEVHRVEVGDSEIPFAICPHDGAIEAAAREHWSPRAREAYAALAAAVGETFAPQIGHRSAEVTRAIDIRPADPLRSEDAEWGEQDSLANVPLRGAL